jgi:D-beta-D-heptose 7-phosphate kinase/D-beta-D-heptose 1-phosphate adenosyltransferase
MTRPLQEVLASLGEPRLLVVGDLALDHYIGGDVERISPEAPIPILRVQAEHDGLGCAGSVAGIVRALGAQVTLIGAVGEDESATRLADLARAAGVQLEAVQVGDRPTTHKTRLLASSHTTHQQVLRVDRESTAPLGAGAIDRLVVKVRAALPGTAALLLSDYGKGVLTPEVLAQLIALARDAGIPVVVDPKGVDYSRYRGATGITPNRSETRAATGIRVETLEDAERAGAHLVDALDLEFALITLDREGMYLRQREGPGVHLPTTPREVFDVTGAGDMVLGVLATALASGATSTEAASLANVAAGLAVERLGVATITRREIAARLALSGASAVVKRIDAHEAGAVADRHRAAGRRVVFTNGCFDILHAGHVRYLQAAKAEGDVLIVGLNADEGVRRLKGPDRPIHGEEDRMEILAALACVDHVAVFEQDTPIELIEAVRPDVLVKGADWAEKGVVGREFVEAHGGRVVLVDLLEGRSTTATVDKIRDQ